MKKNQFLLLLFFMISVLSCSAKQNLSMSFEKKKYKIEPEETVSLVCKISFDDIDKSTSFNRNSTKRFSEKPTITILDDEIELLSFKTEVTKNTVRCFLTVKASKNRLSGKLCKIKVEWGGLSCSATILTKKNPDKFIRSNGIITDPDSYDVLVNKHRRLPENYIPPDLIKIEVATILENKEVNLLRKVAANALFKLVKEAQKDGYEILARSGYRSYSTQKSLFNYYVTRDGEETARKFSAVPGTSEHQSGLAIDVTSPCVNLQLMQSYGETAEGQWLKNNAHRFGFIIRYPKNKEKLTGYAYEPWHLRYIGKDAALQIYLAGICLEEYFYD